MTQEEILQYNKMCAEFIGGKQSKDTLPLIRERLRENDFWLPKFGIKRLVDMKFHSDWNWIHDVIEAIEKLKFNIIITRASITIETSVACKYDINTIYKFHSRNGESETKLEAVVEAINQFLIWYNENK